MSPLVQGTSLRGHLDPTVGKEQPGRRPLVVVSSEGYNALVDDGMEESLRDLTSRGWPTVNK